MSSQGLQKKGVEKGEEYNDKGLTKRRRRGKGAGKPKRTEAAGAHSTGTTKMTNHERGTSHGAPNQARMHGGEGGPVGEQVNTHTKKRSEEKEKMNVNANHQLTPKKPPRAG